MFIFAKVSYLVGPNMPTDGVLKSVYLGAELLEEVLSLREWNKVPEQTPVLCASCSS